MYTIIFHLCVWVWVSVCDVLSSSKVTLRLDKDDRLNEDVLFQIIPLF